MSDKNLNPNISPSGIKSTNTVDSGVKKLNKRPLIIIGAILVLLIIALGYATMKRGELNAKKDEEQQSSTRNDTESLASNFLNKLYKERTTPSEEKNSLVPKPMALFEIPKTTEPTNKAPLGIPNHLPNNSAEQERKEALERYKEELYKTALSGPTSINIGGSSISTESTNPITSQALLPPNPSDIYNQVLQAYQKAGGEQQHAATDNERFLQEQQNSFNYLEAKKTKPISPYELKTGTLIPSVLITAINSDLPGPIKAQVSENVFDTATGNYLLIPQGSTLIGVYSSRVAYGQNRVLIAFNRIVFPDGATLNIGGMNGVDQSGAAGFSDQVNNHYLRIFGSALLLGGITGGIAANDDTHRYQTIQTPKQAMISSIINELGQVAKEMIRQNMNIAPTLEIRSGYRFNVFATQDMILEPLEY